MNGNKSIHVQILIALSLVAIFAASCASGIPDSGQSSSENQSSMTLTLAAYTTPREAYQELIPIFIEQWNMETGQDVTFEESYLGSGAQSRAIVDGFEADVAALSLQADVDRIVNAGLITNDWQSAPNNGMVSTSIVVFAVRKGNPSQIHDWADLAKPGVRILTPNPKTSGGAMWNILALYGAAYRGFVEGVPANDDTAAQAFLISVLKNVMVMDKGARESITNFENGVGDVAITYENEVLVGQQSGQDYEMVVPRSTILIENPVAVIDAYAGQHGNLESAQKFVEFLFSPEAQEIFSNHGLRSVDETVAQAHEAAYPPVEDLFTIEQFDSWAEVTPKFFGENGIYTIAISQVQVPTQ
ncbi:MAG: sulfate ABC transporter substrate-binding protein [Chloroflexi bacterium]|nr:MAG: sulfate ABC transporter substrate-binding protein [Chloroflexota bacterium]